jgi:hypothetical protein
MEIGGRKNVKREKYMSCGNIFKVKYDLACIIHLVKNNI